MRLAAAKPVMWIVASLLLVGATVGGVVTSLTSNARADTTTTNSVPLYGSNGK